MKWIYTADWHIRFNKPRVRTDNYSETQFNKIKWICELANKENASIIVAGDIFDKPVCPIEWQYRYISLFKSVKRSIYTIYGQHDLHFHNPNINKTPYGILVIAEAIKEFGKLMDACNFGEEVPKCKSTHLCIHAPITKDKPPFFMEDAVSAKDFLKKHLEWNYIVSGDFHEQHVTTVNGRILFNPGPIMRTAKDKVDFEPKVVFHDTETDQWEWVNIPIETDVFDFDLMDKDDKTEYKDKLREYAGNIDAGSTKQNFRENVKVVIDKVKPKDPTLEIIDNVLEETT